MIKRVIMCVMCFFLLSACGNSPNTTVNNASGESYVPIDLDTVTESTTGMIISGAIDHNTGEVNAYWIPSERGLDSYRNIEVETRIGYLLRLTHRTELGEGTFAINTSLDTAPVDSQVAGGLLYLWSPDDAQQFTHNPQGTLTIRRQGDDVLGSFELTVENPAGESVIIQGQFFTHESASADRTN